jgi:hypothetical protein
MCNSFSGCGNNCTWIILLIVILLFCGGGCGNDCGCGNNGCGSVPQSFCFYSALICFFACMRAFAS